MKHPFAVKSTFVAALVSLGSFAQSDSPPSTGSSNSTQDKGSSGSKSGSSGYKGSSSNTEDQHEGSASVGNQGAKLSKDDLDFVKDALVSGRGEVRLSQLAATQASDPSVKELAQQMVSEHQSTNDELRQLVEARGYSLPMDSSMGGSGSTGSSRGGTMGGSGSTGSGSTGSSGSIGSGSSSGSIGSDTSSSPGSIGNSGSSSGSSRSGSSSSGTSGSTGSGSTGSSMDSTGGTGTSQGELGTSGGSDTTGGSSSTRPGNSGAYGSVGSGGASGSVGSTGASGSIGSNSVGSQITFDKSDQKKIDDKYNELSKLTGSKFDKAYLSALVDDHKKDIKLFEKQSKKGTDSELKSFATRTLPTLQQHLDQVQSIEKDVKSRRF